MPKLRTGGQGAVQPISPPVTSIICSNAPALATAFNCSMYNRYYGGHVMPIGHSVSLPKCAAAICNFALVIINFNPPSPATLILGHNRKCGRTKRSARGGRIKFLTIPCVCNGACSLEKSAAHQARRRNARVPVMNVNAPWPIR